MSADDKETARLIVPQIAVDTLARLKARSAKVKAERGSPLQSIRAQLIA